MATRILRKVVALVLMVTFLAGSTAVQASLTDSLGMMLNATPAGTYNTRDRGALVGGNVSFHAPVRNVQLFYFDPPRLNAGCGGIDMYMGSFSFINADAFKGMLKAIAQAAAGYFFHLALAALCPQCQSILSQLQQLATILNNNALNTCKVGRDIATWGMDTLKGTAGALEKSAESMKSWIGDSGGPLAAGALSGWFDNFQQIFTKTKEAQQTTKLYTAESGNAVWKAMVQSKATEMFDNAASSNPASQMLGQVEMANTIISLIGTVVIAPQEDIMGPSLTPTSDPVRDAMCVSNPQSCEAAGHMYYPKLSFNDIVKGAGMRGTRTMYKCKTDDGGFETSLADNRSHGCLNMDENGRFSFIGTEKYVFLKLFCAEGRVFDPEAVLDPADCLLGGPSEAGSIVGNLVGGVKLSAAQILFLNNFRLPVARLLMEVQRSRESADQIAHSLAPYMAIAMAVSIGDTMVRIANKAFSKNTNTMLIASVKESITAFSEWVVTATKANEKLGKQIVEAVALANASRTMDPILIAGGYRK